MNTRSEECKKQNFRETITDDLSVTRDFDIDF